MMTTWCMQECALNSLVIYFEVNIAIITITTMMTTWCMQEWFECFGDVFECQPVVRGECDNTEWDFHGRHLFPRVQEEEVLWRLSIFAGEPNNHHHKLHPTIKNSLLGLQIKNSFRVCIFQTNIYIQYIGFGWSWWMRLWFLPRYPQLFLPQKQNPKKKVHMPNPHHSCLKT